MLDVTEQPNRKRTRRLNRLASLPLVDGEWWPNRETGIFKRKDSEIGCTYAFLKRHYDGEAGRPRIPPGFWYQLLDSGKIEGWRVKDGKKFSILWPQREVDQAVRERTTGTPNDIPGEWFGDMFRHKDDGDCLLAVPMAKKIKKSVAYFSYRRTRPHKALNGKIPRWHKVQRETDPRHKWNGPKSPIVYVVSDWVKIAEWEAVRESQLPTEARKGWLVRTEPAEEDRENHPFPRHEPIRRRASQARRTDRN